MKRTFKYLAFAVISLFLTQSIFIAADGLMDDEVKTDCILILGNKVNKDGTLSPRLKARVDKGLQLFRENPSSIIIVSGGLGKEGYYEGTEMKKYLIDRGVPVDNVIADDLGNNTLQTANNYMELSKTHHLSSVTVVSQYYHISRTKHLLKKVGAGQVYGVHADFFEWRDFYSMFRECIAFYKYW
ncbi:YdcF family protein [Sporocytophaga myxococcoides]|uniref:YdcF family protein n=1 Tax=Sporocytophaga myxococcoides TaxID=153721 RepID=UPI00048FFEC5|nr:YdcF family protein [Sporocytophaga myxococcoides]